MKLVSNSDYTFHTDTETGDVYATTRGVNFLVTGDPNNNTKFYAVSSMELSPPKGAQILTPAGFRCVELYKREDVETVIKYYAMKGKPTAMKTLCTMVSAGLMGYIHNETGYHKAPEGVRSLYQQLRGWHYKVHAEWQAMMESQGCEDIAAEYIRLFDQAVGQPGAWTFYKKLAKGQPALTEISEKHLKQVCDKLVEYMR